MVTCTCVDDAIAFPQSSRALVCKDLYTCAVCFCAFFFRISVGCIEMGMGVGAVVVRHALNGLRQALASQLIFTLAVSTLMSSCLAIDNNHRSHGSSCNRAMSLQSAGHAGPNASADGADNAPMATGRRLSAYIASEPSVGTTMA